VKDLKTFNLSLLAKWRWRLLSEDKPQWKLVLDAKYGGVGRFPLSIGWMHKASLWWRDLVGLGAVRGVAGDWLEEAFIHNIGDGGDTIFWHHRWCAVGPLAVAFPRLYSISLQANAFIKDMGVWSSGSWSWNLKWRRPFFLGRRTYIGSSFFYWKWFLSRKINPLRPFGMVVEACSP
jgi:hypothetical protein